MLKIKDVSTIVTASKSREVPLGRTPRSPGKLTPVGAGEEGAVPTRHLATRSFSGRREHTLEYCGA